MLQLKEVLKFIDNRAIQKGLEEVEVFKTWEESFIGTSIAQHTRPISFFYNVLRVATTDSIWLQELYFFKPKLLQKLNEAMGREKIKDIKFFVKPQEFLND